MECDDVLLLWLLPPGTGSFGFQEGRRTQEANSAGGGQVAGASRGGQGGAQEWEESSASRAPWTVSVDRLAGGLWMSPSLVDTPYQCQIMTNGYG